MASYAGLLCQTHPNKAGAEFSGSTAWENQVRSRIYLKHPDNQDGMANPDERILSRSKPNYAQMGEEVSFIWKSWAFTRVQDIAKDFGQEMAVTLVASSDSCASPLGRIQCDTNSQKLIGQKAQSARSWVMQNQMAAAGIKITDSPASWSVSWRMLDNSLKTHSASDFVALHEALIAHNAAC